MNKKIIGIVLILIALISIGVGAFVKLQADNKAAMDQSGDSTLTDLTKDRKPNLVTSTFPNIIKSGKNQTCSFVASSDDAGITEGTIYIANQGNKIRGNFYTKPTEKNPTAPTNDMHLIVLEQTDAYYWSEQDQTGFKMKFDANGGIFAGKPAPDNDTEITNQDQNYEFDCQDWSPDESMFTPPANVQFNELPTLTSQPSEMMQQPAASGAENSGASTVPQLDCSMCDQAPEGAQRDACKQAIGC